MIANSESIFQAIASLTINSLMTTARYKQIEDIEPGKGSADEALWASLLVKFRDRPIIEQQLN